jgi:hypothetical protein
MVVVWWEIDTFSTNIIPFSLHFLYISSSFCFLTGNNPHLFSHVVQALEMIKTDLAASKGKLAPLLAK